MNSRKPVFTRAKPYAIGQGLCALLPRSGTPGAGILIQRRIKMRWPLQQVTRSEDHEDDETSYEEITQKFKLRPLAKPRSDRSRRPEARYPSSSLRHQERFSRSSSGGGVVPLKASAGAESQNSPYCGV
jgi:hypothetical protein